MRNLTVMDPRRVSINRMTASEQMKEELGELPHFQFDQKDNQYWQSLTRDILKVNSLKISNINIKKKTNKFFSFENYSQEFTPGSSPYRQTPSDQLRSDQLNSNLVMKQSQKKPKKSNQMYPQKWNIEYHYIMNDNRCTRIATLDARNADVKLNNEKEAGFRRRSCESQFDGLHGSKVKRWANSHMEIQMHRKKRVANILIDGLKLPRRGSSFSKHQNKLQMLRWAAKIKVSIEVPNNPRISIDNIQSIPEISQINDQTTSFLQKSRLSKTMDPNQIKSIKSIQSNDHIEDEDDESQTIIENSKVSSKIRPQRDVKKLNKAQLNIYYPRSKSRYTQEMSSLYQKRSVDSSLIREQNLLRIVKSESQSSKKGSQMGLPRLVQSTLITQLTDRIEQKSKSRSKDFVGIYINNQSLTQKNQENKNTQNFFKSGRNMKFKQYKKLACVI